MCIAGVLDEAIREKCDERQTYAVVVDGYARAQPSLPAEAWGWHPARRPLVK